MIYTSNIFMRIKDRLFECQRNFLRVYSTDQEFEYFAFYIWLNILLLIHSFWLFVYIHFHDFIKIQFSEIRVYNVFIFCVKKFTDL